jgi:catechol 2,3-dioxygenase
VGGERIHPDTSLGAVVLTVQDLDRMRRFYERSIGLTAIADDGGVVRMGAPGGEVLVELRGDPDAPERPPRTTGLFHLAVLTPSRLDLARALMRVAESGWDFTGASDHLVSEALYLRDPEGNGIELYRDRPRDQWPTRDGVIEMATLPLDVKALAGELKGEDLPESGMAPATRIGHVHLEVADIPATDGFYDGRLGFDVTVGSYPGATFLSAGGYHHHVGANTWGHAETQPPPNAAGLAWFEIVLPSEEELEKVAGRLGDAERRDDGVFARDPSGNGVLLRSA